MRLVFLCIYNREDAYDRMREAQLVYLRHLREDRPDLMEKVSYYFIMSAPIDEEYELDEENHMLIIRGCETRIPGILDKTMTAIRIMLSIRRFDYLVRTNISCCIDIPHAYRILSGIVPEHPCVYGGTFLTLSWRDALNGIVDGRHDGTRYCTGVFIAMSHALCSIMSDKEMDRTVIDDVAIGVCVRAIGEPVHDVCLSSVMIVGSDRFDPGIMAFCNNTNKQDRSIDVDRFGRIMEGIMTSDRGDHRRRVV